MGMNAIPVKTLNRGGTVVMRKMFYPGRILTKVTSMITDTVSQMSYLTEHPPKWPMTSGRPRNAAVILETNKFSTARASNRHNSLALRLRRYKSTKLHFVISTVIKTTPAKKLAIPTFDPRLLTSLPRPFRVQHPARLGQNRSDIAYTSLSTRPGMARVTESTFTRHGSTTRPVISNRNLNTTTRRSPAIMPYMLVESTL